MRIEDYWEDVSIFGVTFTIKESGRTINKILVFSASTTEKDVEKIVGTRFNNVSEVTSLDKWSDALVYK